MRIVALALDFPCRQYSSFPEWRTHQSRALSCWLLHITSLATIACLTVAVSAHSSSSGGALSNCSDRGCYRRLIAQSDFQHRPSIWRFPPAAFGYAIKDAGCIDGHNPADVRRKILGKKPSAQYCVDSVKQLPVNISGIAMLESEVYTTQVYNKHFEALQAVLFTSKSGSEWSGWLNPIQAMRTVSQHWQVPMLLPMWISNARPKRSPGFRQSEWIHFLWHTISGAIKAMANQSGSGSVACCPCF